MVVANASGQSRGEGEASDAGELHQQLLRDAVRGDRTALERLLFLEFGHVHRHIARQLPDWLRGVMSVDDLVQDTFAQAFRDIGRFNFRSDRSLRSWLCKIADNRLQDVIRRLRRKKRGGGRAKNPMPMDAYQSSFLELAALLSDRGDSPSQAAARGEVVQAVQVGISGLPDDQREAVRRRFIERQDYAAAGEAMGRSPDAVRSLVYRAQQSLRDFMGRSSRWFFK
jgi:RNA polymerase sigma-70 factor (ECF subfamily)